MILVFLIHVGQTSEKFCNKTELTLPENAKWWICGKSIDNKVLKGGRCHLECAQFFKALYGKFSLNLSENLFYDRETQISSLQKKRVNG